MGVTTPQQKGELPSLHDQSLWLLHDIMAHCVALSGQLANMTLGSLTFAPKLPPPFVLPVMLPGVWGYGEGEEFTPKHPIGGYSQYTVGLNFGSITLQSLSIGGCGLPIHGSLSLRAEEVVRWDCSL